MEQLKAKDFFEIEKFLNRSHIKGYNIAENFSNHFGIPKEFIHRELNGETWGSGIPKGIPNFSYEGIMCDKGLYSGVLIQKVCGKPFVIRNFPQYQQVDKIEEDDKVFPYYDGLRMTLYTLNFPDSPLFWGKTDRMDYLKKSTMITSDLLGSLKESSNFANIKKFINELGTKYALSGILYGNEVSFRKLPIYSKKNYFIATHIEDIRKHTFLSYEQTKELLYQYNIELICECSVDSDIIQEVGGYIIQRFNEGELEYFHKEVGSFEIDKKRAMVMEVFERT